MSIFFFKNGKGPEILEDKKTSCETSKSKEPDESLGWAAARDFDEKFYKKFVKGKLGRKKMNKLIMMALLHKQDRFHHSWTKNIPLTDKHLNTCILLIQRFIVNNS